MASGPSKSAEALTTGAENRFLELMESTCGTSSRWRGRAAFFVGLVTVLADPSGAEPGSGHIAQAELIRSTTPTATAPARAKTPKHRSVLSLTGTAGVPGGMVAVTVSLERNLRNRAVSADVDLRFDPSVLTFVPPVVASCTLDPRIAGTHGLGGGLIDNATLSLSVFPSDFPVVALGTGVVVACHFVVNANAAPGFSAVMARDPVLADSKGRSIPLAGGDGEVAIVDELPTASPTRSPMPTPMASSTRTSSRLPTVTPTVAPTATRTGTRIVPATLTSTPSPRPTPRCVGDCGGDGSVSISDLIVAIDIAAGSARVDTCRAADRNGDGMVDVGELVAAVNAALGGCP